ncbi:MAG: hypothetical protein HY585_05895 [Candidatus Omnitrophica bacterium]|nr:hypothetical protein [Candidatus Omnitrophota bacterium]
MSFNERRAKWKEKARSENIVKSYENAIRFAYATARFFQLYSESRAEMRENPGRVRMRAQLLLAQLPSELFPEVTGKKIKGQTLNDIAVEIDQFVSNIDGKIKGHSSDAPGIRLAQSVKEGLIKIAEQSRRAEVSSDQAELRTVAKNKLRPTAIITTISPAILKKPMSDMKSVSSAAAGSIPVYELKPLPEEVLARLEDPKLRIYDRIKIVAEARTMTIKDVRQAVKRKYSLQWAVIYSVFDTLEYSKTPLRNGAKNLLRIASVLEVDIALLIYGKSYRQAREMLSLGETIQLRRWQKGWTRIEFAGVLRENGFNFGGADKNAVKARIGNWEQADFKGGFEDNAVKKNGASLVGPVERGLIARVLDAPELFSRNGEKWDPEVEAGEASAAFRSEVPSAIPPMTDRHLPRAAAKSELRGVSDPSKKDLKSRLGEAQTAVENSTLEGHERDQVLDLLGDAIQEAGKDSPSIANIHSFVNRALSFLPPHSAIPTIHHARLKLEGLEKFLRRSMPKRMKDNGDDSLLSDADEEDSDGPSPRSEIRTSPINSSVARTQKNRIIIPIDELKRSELRDRLLQILKERAGDRSLEIAILVPNRSELRAERDVLGLFNGRNIFVESSLVQLYTPQRLGVAYERVSPQAVLSRLVEKMRLAVGARGFSTRVVAIGSKDLLSKLARRDTPKLVARPEAIDAALLLFELDGMIDWSRIADSYGLLDPTRATIHFLNQKVLGLLKLAAAA